MQSEIIREVGAFVATKVLPTVVLLFLFAVAKNFLQGRTIAETSNNNNKQLGFRDKRPPLGNVIGKVSELNVFPGKSMAACTLPKCRVSSAGLQGDRLVMVVNKSRVVVTQRMVPQLSQILATLNHTNKKNGVTLSLPGSSSCSPLEIDLSKVDEKKTVVIDLHSIKAPCVDLGDEAAAWINDALTTLCDTPNKKYYYRMFTLAPKELRRVYRSPAGLLMENAKSFDATLLADLAPITFTSEASLLALNKESTQPVPMNRFRTNIVAALDDNQLAFLEDHVQTIQIGSLKFRSMGPTFRCVIPSVDQSTGEAGFRKNIRKAEPIATLKRLRSGGLRFGLTGLLPTSQGGSQSLAPLFGIYLGTEFPDSMGEVSVGDPIRVLEYKSEPGLVAQLIDAVAITLGLDRAA